jgi:AcrR family transcriptional regulator
MEKLMRTSRRDIAKADKRRRIIEASRQLFSTQGFDGTTVQQIANSADVGAGTLFLYVSDKSELLLLVFREAIEKELERAATRLNKKSGFLASVGSFFTQLISLYQKDLGLSRIYIREFLFHEGQVRAQLDEQNSRILQLLQARVLAAQEKGEVREDVEPQVVAIHMYALYHSTLSFYLASCLPSQSPGEVLTTLLNSFWLGLEPASELPAKSKIKSGLRSAPVRIR